MKRRRDIAVERGREVITPSEVADIEAEALAKALAEQAAGDARLRSDLESWQAQVQLHVDGDVSNTITGEIHGKAVQARDIGSLRIE